MCWCLAASEHVLIKKKRFFNGIPERFSRWQKPAMSLRNTSIPIILKDNSMHLTLILSRAAFSQSQNLMSSLQLVVSSQIFLLSCLIHDFKHFSNYFFSIEASSSSSSAKLKPKIVFPAADFMNALKCTSN